MKRWLRRFAILVAAGTTLSIGVRSARACSCSANASAPQELERAGAVFEGVVRAVRPDPGNPLFVLEVEFEVARRWKGAVSRRQLVLTPNDGGACGVVFMVGESYLVYALRPPDGVLIAVLCSRTQASRTATEDLALLGPGEPLTEVPISSGAGCVAGGRLSRPPPVLVLGAVVVLAGRRARVHRRRD